jgi:uncharacterized membrane protein YjdF
MDEVDYTEPSAVVPGRYSIEGYVGTRSTRRHLARFSSSLEMPAVLLSLFAGAAFLTKMCYLSLALNTGFVIVFLALFYFYVRARLNIQIPVVLLVLVFAALQVDALGNFFRMYGRRFGPIQYDEFAHMAVQVLVSPIIVWLVGRVLQRYGYPLPLKLTAFLAASMVFCLSAAYEIIELWDELYFGGKRIWGPYDTATDLQWDLCGIIIGTLFASLLLGRSTRKAFAWGSFNHKGTKTQIFN